MTLTERILNGDPGVRVTEIVEPAALAQLPPGIRARFDSKTIRWRKDREVWGLSFDLTRAQYIEHGSMKGHHLADRPDYLGMSEADARWVLVKEIEGTLTHELGHAVLQAYERLEGPARYKDVRRSLQAAVDREGFASTYGGLDLHEAFSENMRLWMADPERFGRECPEQTRILMHVMDVVEERLVVPRRGLDDLGGRRGASVPHRRVRA